VAGALIGAVRTVAWLRWRLLVNGLRGGRRRDGLERASRWGAVAAPALLGLAVLGTAAALGSAGLVLGWLAGRGTLSPLAAGLAARGLLLVSLIAVLLGSTAGASPGGPARSARMRLLPLPGRSLHLVEVLSGLADPWVAAVFPALILFPLGLLAGGRAHAAAAGAAAGAAVAILLLALASLLTFVLGLVLRNRRRSEVFTLVFIFALLWLAMLPVAFMDPVEWRGGKGASLAALDRSLPAWTRALPSELHGRSVEAALRGRAGVAWTGIAALGAEAAALFSLSWLAHRTLLRRGDEGSGTRRGRALAPGWSVPGMPRAASAVAVAQVRTALRSVRGRLAMLLPGPTLIVLSVLSRHMPDELPGGTLLAARGDVLLGAGLALALYALLGFTMNQFAADRAGLTLQLLAPIDDGDLVRGKAVGCGLVFGADALVCLACALAVSPGGSPWAWVAVLMAGLATYLFMAPLAAFLSAVLPVASDMSKTGPGGNPHGFAMLVGAGAVLVLSVPPGLMIAAGWPGLVAAWTALAAGTAIPLLRLAAGAVRARRENIALVAQGR
jgi:hypothetical protein